MSDLEIEKLAVTLTALVRLAIANFRRADGFGVELINGFASVALLGLAIYVVVVALWKLRGERRGALVPERV